VAGRRWLRATAIAAGAHLMTVGALAGCSQPNARQDFPGACTPFELVSSVPEDGSSDVPTDAPVSLTFTDFPDPETVTLTSVVLSSGIQTRLGTFRVDLLTRSVRFDLRNQLQPQLTYLLTAFPQLTSLTGCAAKLAQRRFRTGDGPSDPPPQPPAVPTLAAVLPIFAARCAGAACHRQPAADGVGGDTGPDGCLPAPPKGLSLCDQDARAALVGAPATEVSGVKRVFPGDSSRSYLMRKLIPTSSGGPVPTTPGHRDPPGAAPLSDSELRLISDWIDGGAN
jgi:Bacterial Ig-like domain